MKRFKSGLIFIDKQHESFLEQVKSLIFPTRFYR